MRELIANKLNEAAIVRQSEDIRFFNCLNEASAQNKSLKEILDLASREAGSIFAGKSASIFLADEDGQSLRLQHSSVNELWLARLEQSTGRRLADWNFRIPLDGASFSRLLKEQRPVLIEDRSLIRRLTAELVADPQAQAQLAVLIDELEINAALWLPLLHIGRLIGVMLVRWQEAPELELARVKRIGQQLAEIIVHKQGEQKRSETEALYRAVAETSPDNIAVSDLTGTLLFVNQQAARMHGYASPAAMIGRSFLEFIVSDDRQAGAAKLEEILRPGAVRNAQLNFLRSDGSKFPVEINASLIFDDAGAPQAILGVIRDIALRKRAETDLKRSIICLEGLLEQTVNALASTVETRDPYTAGHEKKVARLSCAIATKMGLPQEQIDGIHVAATLHDIGKIGTPAEILSKPVRLNRYELEVVKPHSATGYEILKDIEFPWPAAEMVLEHHERLDGSGYPAGLKGDRISLGARIIAIADVVDAMISHRPYHPAFEIEKAIDEITAGRGRLYDADAVDACVELLGDREFAGAFSLES